MKNIVVAAKDGKKWTFCCSHSSHSWRIDKDTIIIYSDGNNEVKLILNMELFAYLEVEETEDDKNIL